MRSLKSGLIALALSGTFGTLAVIGCSASGADDGIGTGDLPTDPPMSTSGGSALPPKTPDGSGDASVTDSGKKDSGKSEAGVDAGPPPPVEGTPCSKLDAIGTKKCGACGTASTLCQATGDGGAPVWSAYSDCTGELAGGCTPGTTQACGNCGTQTCSQYCGFGSCTGQPAGACSPGTVDYTAAGCTGTTYHSRVCSPTCAYGSFSSTCDTPTTPNKMTLSATVGGVVTAKWTLAGDTLRPSFCPDTVTAASDDGPYVAVEIDNASGKVAEVTLYHSKSPTGVSNLDTVMWTYAGNALPFNNTQLGACVNGVQDSCVDDTLAGNVCGNTASNLDLAGIAGISIPVGGSILVYSSLYDSMVASGDNTLNLNIKTTKLQ